MQSFLILLLIVLLDYLIFFMLLLFKIQRISEVFNSEFHSPHGGTQKHPVNSPRKRSQGQHAIGSDEQDPPKPVSPKHTVAPTPLTSPQNSRSDVSLNIQSLIKEKN